MNTLFSKLSIQRLVLSLALLMAVSTVISALTVFYLDRKLRFASDEISDALSAIEIAQNLEINLLAHKRQVLLFGLTGDENRRIRSDGARKNIENDLENLSLFHGDQPTGKLTAEKIKTAVHRYLLLQDKLIAKAISPVAVYNRVTPDFDSAFDLVENLATANMSEAAEFKNNLRLNGDRGKRLAEIAVALIVIFTGAAFWVSKAFVYEPLSNLRKAIKLFSKGLYDGRVPVVGIGDMRVIAQTFNRMADSLETQRKIQLSFLASIAHDLRNPLGAIQMSLDVFEEDSELSIEKRELFSIVRRQISTLTRLVGDLLDTTRVQAGKWDLELKVCDLNVVIKDVVQLHNSGLVRPRLFLHTEERQVKCVCDAQRLTQVVTNLISNALKYSPEDKPVIVELRTNGEEVIVDVTDQGIGIPPEEISSIFTPFRRSSNSKGAIPGIGLGLSSSEKIVRAHFGRIEIESELGRGSTFSIHLPRVPSVVANNPEITRESEFSSREGNTPRTSSHEFPFGANELE